MAREASLVINPATRNGWPGVNVKSNSLEIQAVWHRADLYTRAEAAAWCESHDFKTDTYRARKSAGEVTHHIHAQFDPDDAVADSWATLSDDFPDGVSVSACKRKGAQAMQFIKGKQSKSDPFEFVMSDESDDRVGDVIESTGWLLEHFKANPIALFGHSHDKPIGTWENVRVEGKRLLGRLKLAAAGTSVEIDTIRKLVEQRILRAVSVGFQPLKAEPREKGGYRFKRQELHECSLVSVPANPRALAIAKAMGADTSQIFSERQPEGRTRAPGHGTGVRTHQTGSRPAMTRQRSKTMNLSERIQAKRDRLVAIKDDLSELKTLAEQDDYELDADEQDQIDALTAESESVVKSIESLEKIEQGLALKAQPAQAARAAQSMTGGVQAKKEKGGDLLVKSITAALIAKDRGVPVNDVLDQVYGDDDRVQAVAKHYISKTATPSATTTATGWAAELVDDDLSGFLQELQPYSVYAALRAAGRGLTFGGANSITIPRRAKTGADDLAGAWVGEAGVIPVKKGAYASQTLNRFKVAVISAWSNELADVSQIEALVRQGIIDDTAQALDGFLLDNSAAVAGVRPAGLLNGVTATASQGATAADVTADLRTLITAMTTINARNPVLLMNNSHTMGLSLITVATGGFLFRDEIASNRLVGLPVIASQNVPVGTVAIVDADSFVSANDGPMFAISDQTVLTMANADDTAPSQADDGAGALGDAEQVPPNAGISVAGAGAAGAAAAGYDAVSMFQTYQTAIRMVLPTSWGLVRANSVAALSSVAW